MISSEMNVSEETEGMKTTRTDIFVKFNFGMARNL